jgi:peptide-methionine (R)-S-oxide reductase
MDVHSCRYYKNDRSSSSSSSSSSSRNKGLILKMAEESNPSSSSETKQQQEGRLRPVEKTDEEWKEILNPEQYYILRKQGTESPGASILNKISVEKNGKEDEGSFICAGCDNPLFVADTKFDSGTGWPSFFAPITSSAVDLKTDYKLIVPRTEVTCSQCGGHLGHVFEGKDRLVPLSLTPGSFFSLSLY